MPHLQITMPIFQCQKVASLHLDATEFLEVKEYTKEEIQNLIKTNNFEQAIHIMAWLMVENGVE